MSEFPCVNGWVTRRTEIDGCCDHTRSGLYLCQQIFETLQSKLGEAGLECTFGPVEAKGAPYARLSAQDGWVMNRYTFRADDLFFRADLSVNSYIDYSL